MEMLCLVSAALKVANMAYRAIVIPYPLSLTLSSHRKMKYQNGRSATSCSGVDSHKLTFRQANAKDLTDIKRMVFKERYCTNCMHWVCLMRMFRSNRFERILSQHCVVTASTACNSAVYVHRINPLGLSAERFIVAENADGQVLGFGQLQQQPSPQDVHFLELRTLIVDNDARYLDSSSCSLAHPTTLSIALSRTRGAARPKIHAYLTVMHCISAACLSMLSSVL